MSFPCLPFLLIVVNVFIYIFKHTENILQMTKKTPGVWRRNKMKEIASHLLFYIHQNKNKRQSKSSESQEETKEASREYM